MGMTKTSATQIAYLNYLAGMGERPERIAIGNVENALQNKGLAIKMPHRNGTRGLFPTVAGAQVIGLI